MARFNACSELAKFWIETRQGYLVTESVPVPVRYGLSDIDILAMHPEASSIRLPNGQELGSRLLIEAKDEHDFDPKGRQFARYIRSDITAMGRDPYVPAVPPVKIKFSLLRQQHFEVAERIFGTDDFDRLFIVHAMDRKILGDAEAALAERRIYLLTLPALVRDLETWYRTHSRPTGLRHSPVGDLFHLLFGYFGVTMPHSENGT